MWTSYILTDNPVCSYTNWRFMESDEVMVLFALCEKRRLLFENRPALYFCNHKEKKNNIRMLDTLFIEDFIDVMEEYFHF